MPATYGPWLPSALANLLLHPQRFIFSWNWKSALLSVLLRGPIFLTAGMRQGGEAAISALLTESAFCAVSAGIYGTVLQTVRDAEPQWATGLFLTLILPAIFQLLEYELHWLRGTPHLRLAEMISLLVSVISTLFNWYAMRRGTLLVGEEGRSFGSDLGRIPQLLLGFVAWLPRRLRARLRASSSQSAHCRICGNSSSG